MSDKPNGAPAGGAGGADDKPDRPLGPDGKPIPGPEQMRQIQVDILSCKNVKNVKQ